MKGPLARLLPRVGMDQPGRHWWFWRPVVTFGVLAAAAVVAQFAGHISAAVVQSVIVGLFCGWSNGWWESRRFDRHLAAWTRKNRWWLR